MKVFYSLLLKDDEKLRADKDVIRFPFNLFVLHFFSTLFNCVCVGVSVSSWIKKSSNQSPGVYNGTFYDDGVLCC